MTGHSSQQTDDRPPAGLVARSAGARLRGMSRQSKIVLAGAAVALLAIVVVTAVTAGSKATPPRVQPPAETFTVGLLGHNGQHISLAEFGGRPLIINFFASWCSPCKRETPLLARFYAAHHGRDLIVGIDANDAAAAAERFVRAEGVTYPVGFDPFPAPVATSYGAYNLPLTVFLNARHRIVKRVLGDVTVTDLNQGVALMDARS